MNHIPRMNKELERFLTAGFWSFVTILTWMVALKVIGEFGWLTYENWENIPLILGSVSAGKHIERLKP